MIKQSLILLVAAALCSGNHGMYHSKKSAMMSPSQYARVASFHVPKPSETESERLQQQASPVAPPAYSFGYQDEGSSRQESADASGRVTGSYHVVNEDGSVRLVKYVADENGFRADVDTSEPGTQSANSADVTMKSRWNPASAPAAPQMHSASLQSASKDCDKHKNGVKTFQASSVNYQGQPMLFNMGAANSGYSSVGTNEFERQSNSPAHVSFLSSAPQVTSKAHRQTAALKAPSAPQLSAQLNSAGMYMPSFSTGNRVERVQAAQPSAYAFNYDAAASGGSSSRRESADATGAVTGQYAVRNEDGSVRIVEYIADKNGFRANVKTNEHGTMSDNPADVTVRSDAREVEFLPLQQQRPVQMAAGHFPAHTYNSRTNMVTQQKVGGWGR